MSVTPTTITAPGRGQVWVSAATGMVTVTARDFVGYERVTARFDRAGVEALRERITAAVTGAAEAAGDVRTTGVVVSVEADRGGVRVFFNGVRHGVEATLPLTRDEAAAVAQAITAALVV